MRDINLDTDTLYARTDASGSPSPLSFGLQRPYLRRFMLKRFIIESTLITLGYAIFTLPEFLLHYNQNPTEALISLISAPIVGVVCALIAAYLRWRRQAPWRIDPHTEELHLMRGDTPHETMDLHIIEAWVVRDDALAARMVNGDDMILLKSPDRQDISQLASTIATFLRGHGVEAAVIEDTA